MTKRILRNESTEHAKEIWQAVDCAAAKAPEWLRERIMNAPLANEGEAKEPTNGS